MIQSNLLRRLTVCILPLAALICCASSHSQVLPPGSYVEGEVLVGITEAADNPAEQALLTTVGDIVTYHSEIHEFRLHLPLGLSVPSAIALLTQIPGVLCAEPNYITHGLSTPNDAYYNTPFQSGYRSQYGPQRIQADLAWNIWQPRKQIVIAVNDTGIDTGHPDLVNKLFRDANGVISYNAITHPYPPPPPPRTVVAFPGTSDAGDDNGHGTHVSGIAAAQTNSGAGIAGIAGWNGIAGQSDTNNVKIMPVKVLDSTSTGTLQRYIDGIAWSVKHGANIINCSYGGAPTSAMFAQEVAYAWQQGCLVVAAAGNAASSNLIYPAAYPNVISVAASDSTDTLSGLSEYGSWVSVAAPGGQAIISGSTYTNVASEAILSTTPTYHVTQNDSPENVTQIYGYEYGTSMACPHVSGEAALIWSQNPSLTND